MNTEDYLEALTDARKAAYGDSNDAEIECLQMALDEANSLLLEAGLVTQEQLDATVADDPGDKADDDE